jgi:major membrane immunogen (membrane-anchored lipoprotein)
MKKHLLLVLTVLAIMLTFAGCAKSESEETQAATAAPKAAPAVSATAPVATGTYADGVYFAAADSFASSGWKETVTLTVEGGKIIDADWNGVNINAGADKKSYDKAGKYNMVKFGNAQAEWYEQATKAEAYLLETQDPTAISYSDAEGHTDAIAGVSVHVNAFFDLASEALASGPVGRGPYEDGAYFAIADSYPSSGWKEYVSLTVLNGRIAAVNWSAVNRTGDDKKPYDKAGNYNMVKFGGAQAEWYEQAAKAEAYLLETQDLEGITYKDDEGHTDDIAGVSIHVNAFYDLAKEALAAGPNEIGPFQDGSYYASDETFSSSGWKGYVSLLVNNGNIESVYWSGVDKDGRDKKQVAAEGGYGMIAHSEIGKGWHEQAAAVEAYLLSTQDPTQISYKDDGGHTDDIAGATMSVSNFYALVEQALAAGPKQY